MKRRGLGTAADQRPEAGRGAGGKSRGRAGNRPAIWRLAALVGAVIVVSAALLRLAGNDEPARERRVRPVARPAADPRQAYATAVGLVHQHRFLESLPWYEAAVQGAPEVWGIHHDYAAALLNAVHESRQRHGVLGFAVRASPERVTMVRTAMDHLVAAERLAARNARGLAQVRWTRAQAMGVWGFPWEALVTYRQAEWADSSWRELAGRADAVMEELRDPARR